MTGTNRRIKPIMTATFCSGISGTGFKNHCTAALIAEGRVVATKVKPSKITKAHRQQTRMPANKPSWETVKNLMFIKGVPPVESTRASPALKEELLERFSAA